MIETEINIIIMLYLKIQLVLDNCDSIAISLLTEVHDNKNAGAKVYNWLVFFCLAAEVMLRVMGMIIVLMKHQ